ncbi:MAG: serine/threonine-protein kinase [Polyangiaceae bacterium]
MSEGPKRPVSRDLPRLDSDTSPTLSGQRAGQTAGQTAGQMTGAISGQTGPGVDPSQPNVASAVIESMPGQFVSPTTMTELNRVPEGLRRIAPAEDSYKFDSTAPPTAAADSIPDPYIGKTIDGRYFVERVLGEGGMGVVYTARHKIIDKRVAVKVLRGDFARDKEITDRFLQEAKAASSIGNPHIVDISDFGTLPDGAAYFVMEFLDGKSLGQIMNENRPVPVMRLAHLAKQIAAGLSAAHAAGIVHRDLKPDNVIVIKRGNDSDFVKILDFGIAKVGGETARITRAGSVFGTPHYMSPEQAAGASVDQRTDVYALGVILYEMASGKVPFDADNFMGILTQHMYKAPVPILALVPQPDIPPGLDAIILKCLSKKLDGRYASMDELIEDLTTVESGGVPKAVGEMMARSGGFNLPVDYFSNGRTGMPAPIPATPRAGARSRMPLFAVIGAVASIALVALVVLLLGGNKTTSVAVVPASAAIASETPGARASASASATAPIAAATPSTLVLIGTDPTDARITRDGTDLGSPPVAVEVPQGQSINITVTRLGFVTQTLTIDASSPKQLVKLTPNVKASTSHGGHPRNSGGSGSQAQAPIDGFSDPFLTPKH